MRFAVVKTIYKAGLENQNIYFITGDYGHADTEGFREHFGSRYFNAGMSEQNIIGMAAGLALSGMKVFVYSIVPFITLRCYEQIKVDVCDHNVDVTIIGGGGGFAYGDAGATHYSIEDIAAMRALPNMKVVAPANPMEAQLLTEEILKIGGPAYIRIGRGKEPDPEHAYTLRFGKAYVAREGEDITIISTGTILEEALRAAGILAVKGVSTEVLNMHTIKPLDADAIQERVGNRKAIFTLEEHSIYGGLGSAVSEVIAEIPGEKPRFLRFGVPDRWPGVVGSQHYLRDISGISAEKVVERISNEIMK